MSILTSKSYILQVDRLEDGRFFVYDTQTRGKSLHMEVFRYALLAWHAPSYYGTAAETGRFDEKIGIFLSPLTAAEVMGAAAMAIHADLDWVSSKTMNRMLQLSELLVQALGRGRFCPSFACWQAGGFGWRLLLSDEEESALQGLDQDEKAWISAAVTEYLSRSSEAQQAWIQLVERYPLLVMKPGDNRPFFTDETEFLTAIGWQRDQRLFRSVLQLLEPVDNEPWRLQPLLQDRDLSHFILSVGTEDDPSGSQSLLNSWNLSMTEAREAIASSVQKWLHVAPGLEDESRPGVLKEQMTDAEAWRFLEEDSLRLAETGEIVLLPSWWEEIRRLKPALKAQIKSNPADAGESLLGMNQLLRFDWKVAVGDLELTEQQFLELADQQKRLIQFKGQWIQLDPELLQQIRKAMKASERKKGLPLREALEAFLLSDQAAVDRGDKADPNDENQDRAKYQIELNQHLRTLFQQLQQTSSVELQPLPEGLHATLRPYQHYGMSWMLFLRKFGFGGCLADDMGLGKTIQFIAYLLVLHQQQRITVPSLIICPTSVLGNWQKELARFAPDLRVVVHYGPQRGKGEEAFIASIAGAHVVLTTYMHTVMDQAELGQVEWSVIGLDEAQNIKNAYTKQSSVIRKLPAVQRIALTGTPIENRLTELWSIFDFVTPGYLGGIRDFTRGFVQPIERGGKPELVEQVQKLIRPFLLRRVKKDPAVQLDLPDKNESKVYLQLTREQGALYESVVQQMLERIDRLSFMERRALIVSTLTKLKQICNHPAMYIKETGAIKWQNRSNKLMRLIEMVSELRTEEGRCLIFTQFVETGGLLQAALEQELQEQVLFLHGGVSKSRRDKLIAAFQGETSDPVRPGIFILSLKAGGTGLNLTAANHVFHFDRWWNPAVENQATDRAFRIGQTRDVQVHKFISLGTLEEQIDEMIERKQSLSEQVIGGGEGWITELSTEDLRQMFALRKEWIEK
ncbi:DEAD/DEAH box helicase [Paenibacillus sp. y28]|uniref:DEAD/DEAH box helicase n=1 Tax=Paenibacillus sp. y28 TaxID=3129110 RepID=UPI00301740F5